MRPPAIAIRIPARTALAALVAALAGIFTLVAPATAHAASYSPSSYASRLLSLVNQAREQNGLRPLTATSGTGSVAAAWTSQLASDRSLSHNPNLAHDLSTHGSSHWMTYGENVGQGQASSPDGLFKAYMASPEHRDNILTSAYRYVGVGVVFTGRTAWNTFDFVDAYGSTTSHKAPAPVQHPAVHHVATAPVTHHAAAPKPLARPAKPAHRPARPHVTHRVQVKGFSTRSPAPRPLPESALAATPASVSQSVGPATSTSGTSTPRTLLVGLAVVLLAAAARRWILTSAVTGSSRSA
ncbi:MAG: hypothetical protein QOF18_1729 [Frankiaceae bacterium]|jgi:uncharacterized protein YkwD|nr:hypothetical protein [Frankiaceae bacterium]